MEPKKVITIALFVAAVACALGIIWDNSNWIQYLFSAILAIVIAAAINPKETK